MLERHLLLLARLLCTDADREHIVEPLIADLQRELSDARTPGDRRAIWWRGIASFWRTLALCAVRGLWRSVVNISPMGVFVGAYWIGITVCVVFGFNWVRTGEWSASEGIISIRWLSGLFGPLGLASMFRQAWGKPRRRLMIAAFIAASAVCLAIVPGNRLSTLALNVVVLVLMLIQRPQQRTRAS